MADGKTAVWKRIARTATVVLALYLVGCWFLSGQYLSPSRTHPLKPLALDDMEIAGAPVWASPALQTHKRPQTVVILAHGYGGDRGHWAELAQRMQEEGFNVIIPAMPAHDANPVREVGFGPKEAELLADLADWAHDKGAERIVVCGVSMGGAAAWLATAKTMHIDGIVTEGAYARFGDAMTDWLNAAMPGGSVLLRPVVWFAQLRSGIDPEDIRPVAAASQWKKQTLIIQAEDDRLVKMGHAQTLWKATGGELWCVPDAVHANCYTASPKEFERRVVTFIKGVVPGNPAIRFTEP